MSSWAIVWSPTAATLLPTNGTARSPDTGADAPGRDSFSLPVSLPSGSPAAHHRQPPIRIWCYPDSPVPTTGSAVTTVLGVPAGRGFEQACVLPVELRAGCGRGAPVSAVSAAAMPAAWPVASAEATPPEALPATITSYVSVIVVLINAALARARRRRRIRRAAGLRLACQRTTSSCRELSTGHQGRSTAGPAAGCSSNLILIRRVGRHQTPCTQTIRHRRQQPYSTTASPSSEIPAGR